MPRLHGCLNTLTPRQNGHRFADDTFKRIFLNGNVTLKFVPKGPINNNPALVQMMAWRRSGDKPLSESMMVSLLTHICVTRPQWVKPKDCLCMDSHVFLVALFIKCWSVSWKASLESTLVEKDGHCCGRYSGTKSYLSSHYKYDWYFEKVIFNSLYRIVALSGECQRTSLTSSHHWFR